MLLSKLIMKLTCSILFLLSIAVILSCSESKEKSESTNPPSSGVVKLEKIDSVQIEYLGNPTVHDIDPKSRTILFMEHGDTFADIYLADFEGNILYTYTKFGDLPDTYGLLFAPLKILGENEYMAYGINGFLTYDFSGELISRTKIQDIAPYNFARKSMGYALGITEQSVIYINQGSRKTDYSDLNLYEEVNTMVMIDRASGDKKELMQIPKTSLYRSGKYFYRDAWAPIFEIVDDKLLLVFGGEPKIYVFGNTPHFDLIEDIPLNIPNYNFFEGETSYNPNSLMYLFSSGKIETLTWVDGYYLVGYFPGYDKIDLAVDSENKSPEESREFGDRMRKKYLHRVAIFDSLGNLVNDFAPTTYDPRSIILRDGQLWAMEKYDQDVEKDYFRVFRLGLKID